MNGFSIYITRMSRDFDENYIACLMGRKHIGEVIGVDFINIKKKPGFKAAIVHFQELTDTAYYQNTFYSRKFWKRVASGKSCRIDINQNEYWIFLKYKSPEDRLLENLIQEQEKKIAELSENLRCVHVILYQLIGGLFNHKTQGRIINKHLSILSLQNILMEENMSRWSIWPTTRQGDECEERISCLEKRLGVEFESSVSSHVPIKLENESLEEMTDEELEYHYYQMSDEESVHKRIKEAKRHVRDFRGY